VHLLCQRRPLSELCTLALHRRCTFESKVANSHAWSCEEAELASLGWIYFAEQLYTDAALVLDTSTRVAAASRSCLIDVHFTFVVDHAEGRINRVHVRCCEEAYLASLGWI
jgi:hypothetical protein